MKNSGNKPTLEKHLREKIHSAKILTKTLSWVAKQWNMVNMEVENEDNDDTIPNLPKRKHNKKDQIQTYEILGKGTNGIVYKGYDPVTKEHCALKFVKVKHKLNKEEKYLAEKEASISHIFT